MTTKYNKTLMLKFFAKLFYKKAWPVALCRRERLNIVRGEEGSAATASQKN